MPLYLHVSSAPPELHTSILLRLHAWSPRPALSTSILPRLHTYIDSLLGLHTLIPPCRYTCSVRLVLQSSIQTCKRDAKSQNFLGGAPER